jgi:NitT/TauT family transport system permease protein
VSTAPFVATGIAIATIYIASKLKGVLPKILLPLSVAVIFVACWQVSCELKRYDARQLDGTMRTIEVFPTPWAVLVEMRHPIRDGTLLKYTIDSLYRIACGFTLAAAIGIPVGLWAGWSLRASRAMNPLIQALRPISPIAWIPLAILWFGVQDAAAIFLITLASFFPIVTGTMAAVRSIPLVYVRSAQNFGLEGLELFRRVVFPACLPQIVTSLRLALGIAWMVIVAAEMIAVDSGLGYLVMDARNASNYERVIGAMIAIGLIGVGLDLAVRRLELFDEVRWGFPNQRTDPEQTRLPTHASPARTSIFGFEVPWTR